VMLLDVVIDPVTLQAWFLGRIYAHPSRLLVQVTAANCGVVASVASQWVFSAPSGSCAADVAGTGAAARLGGANNAGVLVFTLAVTVAIVDLGSGRGRRRESPCGEPSRGRSGLRKAPQARVILVCAPTRVRRRRSARARGHGGGGCCGPASARRAPRRARRPAGARASLVVSSDSRARSPRAFRSTPYHCQALHRPGRWGRRGDAPTGARRSGRPVLPARDRGRGAARSPPLAAPAAVTWSRRPREIAAERA
jgi:hypothetical protein